MEAKMKQQENSELKKLSYPSREEIRAAQLACCGRCCNACEAPAAYAWRKREVDMSFLLEKAIQKELTEAERGVISEFWFEEKTLTEIARKRNIAASSVKGTLGRAQAKLERVLSYAVRYQQGVADESITPLVLGRARVIAAARKNSGNSVGERLQRLRLAENLSIAAVSTASDIPEKRLVKLEGGAVIQADELLALSSLFGVTADFILKGEFNG